MKIDISPVAAREDARPPAPIIQLQTLRVEGERPLAVRLRTEPPSLPPRLPSPRRLSNFGAKGALLMLLIALQIMLVGKGISEKSNGAMRLSEYLPFLAKTTTTTRQSTNTHDCALCLHGLGRIPNDPITAIFEANGLATDNGSGFRWIPEGIVSTLLCPSVFEQQVGRAVPCAPRRVRTPALHFAARRDSAPYLPNFPPRAVSQTSARKARSSCS